MLVLGRREQQKVIIDLNEFGLGNINVFVTRIQNRSAPNDDRPMVRLGFEADKRINISREENYDPERHRHKAAIE